MGLSPQMRKAEKANTVPATGWRASSGGQGLITVLAAFIGLVSAASSTIAQFRIGMG
jgi:hypothetical protein